jgi:hypothetical protein
MSIAENQARIMRKIRDYLVDEGVATNLIEMMIAQSSQEVYWVDGLEWLQGVPSQAPWFDEMVIAQCNARPEYYQALSRIIFDMNESEERRREASKRQNEYSMALLQCERALTASAQREFRRNHAKSGDRRN